MDEGGESESRDQHVFRGVPIQFALIDMARDVARLGMFGPAPLRHHRCMDLQALAWGRETMQGFAVDQDSNHLAILANLSALLVTLAAFEFRVSQ